MTIESEPEVAGTLAQEPAIPATDRKSIKRELRSAMRAVQSLLARDPKPTHGLAPTASAETCLHE